MAKDAAHSEDAGLTASFVMDGDGNVAQWDPSAESMFGWSRTEALGRKLSELIIPEKFRTAHEAGLARFKASGHGAFIGRAIGITVLDRDGREFPVEITISVETTAGNYRFPTVVRRKPAP